MAKYTITQLINFACRLHAEPDDKYKYEPLMRATGLSRGTISNWVGYNKIVPYKHRRKIHEMLLVKYPNLTLQDIDDACDGVGEVAL